MAVFTHTDVNTLVSTIRNGKKIVSTTVTISDTGTDATTITSTLLTRALGWIVTVKNPGTTPTTFVTKQVLGNTFTITPAADATGAVLEILAVGV